METVIKVSSSEFNIDLFDKIKSYLSDLYNADITITVKETSPLRVVMEEMGTYARPTPQEKKKKAAEAIKVFKTMETDMSHYRFNRDEANER